MEDGTCFRCKCGVPHKTFFDRIEHFNSNRDCANTNYWKNEVTVCQIWRVLSKMSILGKLRAWNSTFIGLYRVSQINICHFVELLLRNYTKPQIGTAKMCLRVIHICLNLFVLPQTYFGLSKLVSEMHSFWESAIWNCKFWSETPCI